MSDTNDPSTNDLPPGDAARAVDPAPTDEFEPAVAAEPDTDGDAAIDLDAIERDLDDVQAALDRLNDGTYWTDEVTGETIADEVMEAHPTARVAETNRRTELTWIDAPPPLSPASPRSLPG